MRDRAQYFTEVPWKQNRQGVDEVMDQRASLWSERIWCCRNRRRRRWCNRDLRLQCRKSDEVILNLCLESGELVAKRSYVYIGLTLQYLYACLKLIGLLA
jgi:hypothetical protein